MAALFVVRVWLPDRPGALGAVASRIGAVRGDLVGIDILERGAGRAIDELVVSLPDADLVPLLVKEMQEVEGVDVEDIREVRDELPDPRVAALESAAELLAQADSLAVCSMLVDHVTRDFEAEWATVVRDGHLVATNGPNPSTDWVIAFVAGSVEAGAAEVGPDDIAWAPLDDHGGALVIGRAGRPFRARERSQLVALARIVGWRLQT